MRPPQNAGENAMRRMRGRARDAGFNEAPAKRGGKHADYCLHGRGPSRFNEAPAKRGGKQSLAKPGAWPTTSFNEAPAKRGGKPPNGMA